MATADQISVMKLAVPMDAPFGPPLKWELVVADEVLGWFPCMLHAFYVGKLVTTGEFNIGKSHEIRRTEVWTMELSARNGGRSPRRGYSAARARLVLVD